MCDLVDFFFLFFFEGFKGQVRWPKGPPPLGPKPSLSVSFVVDLFLVCFVFCCFWFLEGFKG